jgi:hypothetical protein
MEEHVARISAELFIELLVKTMFAFPSNLENRRQGP